MLAAITFLLPIFGFVAFLFRKAEKKSTSLVICLIAIACGLVLKLGYERHSKLPNFYSILQVERSSSALDIRQSYKKISKKLHPDKNDSPNAEIEFQRVKLAYDVLMDDQTRDLYNRFGESNLEFDPRKDELKLLSNIGFTHIQWFVIIYILTIPPLTRASRTWIIFVCIGMIISEVMLSLTETKLPDYTPFKLTEFELIGIMHGLFPGIVALLLTMSAYFYIDVDKQCGFILTFIASQQKAVDEMLTELNVLLDKQTISNNVSANETKSESNNNKNEKSLDAIKMNIAELQQRIRVCQGYALANMEILKNANINFASKYYWVVFVLMYVIVYLAQ